MEFCQINPQEKSINIPTENLVFSMDHVFSPDTQQEVVYDTLAKATIKDVLKGYNGTLIAYGQTGSGKTYTMYGPDVFDEDLRGIIPRAAEDIFTKIDDCEEDIEFDIRCSMLEIYKENLRDLLWLSSNIGGFEEPPQLKIKESPAKGIYVEKLSQEVRYIYIYVLVYLL